MFFLGYLLKAVFAVQLGWFPPSGRQSVTIDATSVTGFAVLDGILTREWDASLDALVHLVLPAVALGDDPARGDRADHPGVGAGRAGRGLRPHREREGPDARHGPQPARAAQRAAAGLTMIGLLTGLLLAGAVLTETVFVWGGVGTLLADAITQRDYPRLQAVLLLGALVFVLVNLLVDLSYALIDPRVRLS